jgi:hypothetical protein
MGGLPVSAEYLAGFFDGEGTVTIASKPSIEGRRYHYVSMRIGNTDRPVLEAIAETWGGTIFDDNGPARRLLGRKPVYVLVWGARAAQKPLEAMLPHLRLKHPQTLISLEFLRLTARSKTKYGRGKGYGGGTKPLPRREWGYRNYLQWLMHHYNGLSRSGDRPLKPAWGGSTA